MNDPSATMLPLITRAADGPEEQRWTRVLDHLRADGWEITLTTNGTEWTAVATNPQGLTERHRAATRADVVAQLTGEL